MKDYCDGLGKSQSTLSIEFPSTYGGLLDGSGVFGKSKSYKTQTIIYTSSTKLHEYIIDIDPEGKTSYELFLFAKKEEENFFPDWKFSMKDCSGRT